MTRLFWTQIATLECFFVVVCLLSIFMFQDIEVSAAPNNKNGDKCREAYCYGHPPNDSLRDVDSSGRAFLCTNWQMQVYLMEQADVIEKLGGLFSSNAFELILRQLQKSAPELHHVRLQYLNSLYHDDCFAALENLHHYFDYSSFGRYEITLLRLGMMHFHFGHPKQALEDNMNAPHAYKHIV